MAKGKEDTTLLATLLSVPLFKANQGAKVRQATAAAIAAVVIIGCMRLRGTVLSETESYVAYLLPNLSEGGARGVTALIYNGLPLLLLLSGLWFAYRLVNWPRFTNFLIDVEHEMEKVSWASWDYLYRATAVVLGTMVVLGVYLFMCDVIWQRLFGLVGFLDLEALGQ